jgi:hypothetical protein
VVWHLRQKARIDIVVSAGRRGVCSDFPLVPDSRWRCNFSHSPGTALRVCIIVCRAPDPWRFGGAIYLTARAPRKAAVTLRSQCVPSEGRLSVRYASRGEDIAFSPRYSPSPLRSHRSSRTIPPRLTHNTHGPPQGTHKYTAGPPSKCKDLK